MNKVASRLLIFFIGIPIVIAFIVAPFCNHILLHILVCLISALGASELYDIFSAKYKLLNKKLLFRAGNYNIRIYRNNFNFIYSRSFFPKRI